MYLDRLTNEIKAQLRTFCPQRDCVRMGRLRFVNHRYHGEKMDSTCQQRVLSATLSSLLRDVRKPKLSSLLLSIYRVKNRMFRENYS